MDSFFEKLANSSLGGQSSEHLKLLGKRAAGAFLRKEADSLSSAVRDVVASEDLNKDQTHRVVEMANQAAWNGAFHQGGENVSFDPASADNVLGELSAKPQEVNTDHAMDYYNDVPNQIQDVDWGETFGIKEDTPEYDAINPIRQEQEAVEKTASALDVARFGADQLLAELTVKGEEVYDLIKQAHLSDGFGILQIGQAIGQAVQDPSFGIDLVKVSAARLAKEGVAINEREELMKMAHPLVVNTEHPLMQAVAVLEKLAFSYYTAEDTHEKLRNRHRAATRLVRDKLRGL